MSLKQMPALAMLILAGRRRCAMTSAVLPKRLDQLRVDLVQRPCRRTRRRGRSSAPSLVTCSAPELALLLGLPFDHDGLDAQAGQHAAPSLVPALASLMPPVRGDLAAHGDAGRGRGGGAGDDARGEDQLVVGAQGMASGGTSSATMVVVSHRPPMGAYFSGVSSKLAVRSVMLTRNILDIIGKPPCAANSFIALIRGSSLVLWG